MRNVVVVQFSTNHSIPSNSHTQDFHAQMIGIKRFISLSIPCKWLLAVTALVALHSYGAPPKTDQPLSLNEDYERISTQAYRELAQQKAAFNIPQKNLSILLRQVYQAEEKRQPERVIGLVAANMELIKENITAVEIPALTRSLLKHGAPVFANDLLKLVSMHADDYQLGQIKFELARHHAEHGDWQKSLAYLRTIDISHDLPKQEGDEAFILLGAELQQQKKHRQAIEYYARIKPDSIHYRVAQLNIAVAYIRQDWWTDAHIAIKNALKTGPLPNDELANRLYTLLGFSQLQNGFYRDARESFRDVHIKSRYANRALLGIGMAALHQEDFIGALNAFNHLKKGDDADVSVAESYLLGAFALEKLGQQETASASYTEAITFYEQRIALYDMFLNKLGEELDAGGIIKENLVTQISATAVGQKPELTDLTNKMRNLSGLLDYQLSTATAQSLAKLNRQLQAAYIELAQQLFKKQQTIMHSYLSQARFGLAKLYDSK